MYDMKALYEAYSVEEAVKLRLEHPEAQIIAGGTDVLVQMREGRRAGKELISIQKIDSMRGVCMEENENIRIGSLTTFSHITHNPIIIEKINVLGEAVDMVGGPQIRNAGIIGGTMLTGGVGNIIGTLFGVLSLSTIKNIVSSLGLDEAWWTNITVAAMICLFLVIQSLVLSRKNKDE